MFAAKPPIQIPALFDEIREGLGTSEVSLQEMITRMRRIRDADDPEKTCESPIKLLPLDTPVIPC